MTDESSARPPEEEEKVEIGQELPSERSDDHGHLVGKLPPQDAPTAVLQNNDQTDVVSTDFVNDDSNKVAETKAKPQGVARIRGMDPPGVVAVTEDGTQSNDDDNHHHHHQPQDPETANLLPQNDTDKQLPDDDDDDDADTTVCCAVTIHGMSCRVTHPMCCWLLCVGLVLLVGLVVAVWWLATKKDQSSSGSESAPSPLSPPPVGGEPTPSPTIVSHDEKDQSTPSPNIFGLPDNGNDDDEPYLFCCTDTVLRGEYTELRFGTHVTLKGAGLVITQGFVNNVNIPVAQVYNEDRRPIQGGVPYTLTASDALVSATLPSNGVQHARIDAAGEIVALRYFKNFQYGGMGALRLYSCCTYSLVNSEDYRLVPLDYGLNANVSVQAVASATFMFVMALKDFGVPEVFLRFHSVDLDYNQSRYILQSAFGVPFPPNYIDLWDVAVSSDTRFVVAGYEREDCFGVALFDSGESFFDTTRVWMRQDDAIETDPALCRRPHRMATTDDLELLAVAVPGDSPFVGVPEFYGLVRIYRRIFDQNTLRFGWDLLDTIEAPTNGFSRFGFSVTWDDSDRLFVGAPDFGSEYGRVYMYQLASEDDWVVAGFFEGDTLYEEFGSSVSSRSGTMAVGSPGYQGVGAVKMFYAV